MPKRKIRSVTIDVDQTAARVVYRREKDLVTRIHAELDLLNNHGNTIFLKLLSLLRMMILRLLHRRPLHLVNRMTSMIGKIHHHHFN